MTSDWQKYCRLARYTVGERDVRVTLSSERTHRVRIFEEEDAWRLEATVAQRLSDLPPGELVLLLWRRNRAIDLVGFRLDERERILGEAWIPKEGTDAADFRLVLDAVARECDRLEGALTGIDLE